MNIEEIAIMVIEGVILIAVLLILRWGLIEILKKFGYGKSIYHKLR